MAPSLTEVVEAIAEVEPLDRAAGKLGLPREAIVALLREAAAPSLFHPPPQVRERLAVSPAPKPAPVAGRRAVVYADGASRGNPGLAGAGAVLVLPDGQTFRLGRFLGVQTNNVAEYQGVILGLEKATELGVRVLDVRADSMLTMMQLKGEWKIRNEGLKPLFERARQLINRFDDITFRHVPREQNQAADEMSNRAIDDRM